MRFANEVSTWVTILATVIGGSIWIGAVASDTASNKVQLSETQHQVDKLRDEGPPAIARLEEKTNAVQRDVDSIKQTQQEILQELRKK